LSLGFVIFSTKVEFKQTATVELIRTTCYLASYAVFSGTLFYCWFMPKMNESLARERSKMKDDIIQVISQELKNTRIQIEGEKCKAKKCQGQTMQT